MRNTPKKIVLALSLMLTSGLAWAGESPPTTPSAITIGTNVVPVTGMCGGGFSQGQVATPGDVNTAQDNIVDAINNIYFNDWQPLYMNEQSKDRVANKTFMQALMMHMNAMAKAQQEARARLFETQNAQMPPSMPCAGKTCTGQTTLSQAVAGGAGALGMNNHISGYIPINHSADNNLVSKVSARQPLKTYATQCTEFASAREIAEGICPDPVSAKPNLDILGSTLLDMPPTGHDETHKTLDDQALHQLVDNLVQAPPVGKRHKDYYKTLAGQAEEGKMFSTRARISLSRTVLAQIAAMDTQNPGFGTDFAKSLNKKLIVPTPLAANASLMQALAWEDQATYGNRKWYQMIAKMSKAALAKERVILQAQQLQYQYIAFRQRTNIEALLATLLAEKTDAIQKQVNRDIIQNVSSGPAAKQ
ncbi:hypothetical protein ACJU26_05850 [Acidithiobacillus sp. M4-SHS-6]|uniref:hypothetical protein n=1 Tax=Acidithiobacillus sp. M4-SHS-6 TaxID=3383024 RepID=UPI0039BE1261